MCLVIKEVPAKGQKNLVPCWKVVEKGHILSNTYKTLYRGTPVPSDGVLHPLYGVTQQHIIKHDEIHEGAIHAFTTVKYSRHIADCWQAFSRKAYAFGVIAYGDNNDVASTLLYIPSLDFSTEKSKRMKKIKEWEKREKYPTDKEVKDLFPAYQPPFKH